jgi:DNA-binding MltR family transcriptional regulator
MVWISLSADEHSAIEDMEATKSDRAAAIVAAALLEERLAEAIKTKLHREKEVVERLFRPSGPLGSFSAKIDLGFLMGLYSKDAHADLVAIKEIRNEFAHRLRTKNFTSQRVRDLCQNIEVSDWNFEVAPARRKDKFKKQKMFVDLDVKSPTYVRDKYVRACQVFVVIFVLFTRKRKPRTPYF